MTDRGISPEPARQPPRRTAEATGEAGVSEWFRSWFGCEYLALYPHRNRVEARQAVDLLKDATAAAPGARVLDLACGAGRHLAELHRVGYRTAGLDLSAPLLAAARTVAPQATLVRGDMRRIPFRSGTFQVVSSYFTSFGYFAAEEDDRGVLAEVRRVLCAGGWFLLDFLNADQVEANLRERDWRTVAGMEVVQERRLVESGRIVEKRITISGPAGASPRAFVERVRMYRPAELAALLASAGLEPGPRFGGYDRSPLAPDSLRCVLLARAR